MKNLAIRRPSRIHFDYDEIVRLVAEGSSVLDLGCGNGELLQKLIEIKGVRGRGIEIEEPLIIECISKGISVFQGDLDEGLRDYPTGIYDYVILNQTLQVTKKPTLVLKEMLRVGHYGIVSFPNFAYYKVRLNFILQGRMPVTRELPYRWFNTPNIHLCTRKDFLEYCTKENIKIIKEINISKNKSISKWFANWRSADVLCILSKNNGQ